MRENEGVKKNNRKERRFVWNTTDMGRHLWMNRFIVRF